MADAFVELFGDKLLKSSETLPTSTALEGKVVGIYFSAHWCPPCRGFTPKLAEFYKTSLSTKGLEVVFVSSDSDEKSFNDYFEEMPWLALPYSEREKKSALSKKFKVKGIPSFVLLDSAGNLISLEGRSVVMKDPTGENFPWIPKSFAEVLGTEFVGADDTILDRSAVEGKVLGLYFSAHWCPPCRGFTPKLAQWYKKISPNLPNFQIVFISSDESEKEFQEYFREMPWIAIPHKDRSRKEQLSELFGVEGIPTFVIVDEKGVLITDKARGLPVSDPEGKEFPWRPKAVKDISGDHDGLQETPSLVVFADGAPEGEKEKVAAALRPIAEKFRDSARESGDEKILFFTGDENATGILNALRRISQQPPLLKTHKHPLKERETDSGWRCDGCRGSEGTGWNCKECDFDYCDTCKAAASEAGQPTFGIIFNFEEEVFHLATDVDFTNTDSISELVEKFLAGSLPSTPLKL